MVYHIVDERECGRGESYNYKAKKYVEIRKTLIGAIRYIEKKYSNTRGICIEEWDDDKGMFVDGYTLTQARKTAKIA